MVRSLGKIYWASSLISLVLAGCAGSSPVTYDLTAPVVSGKMAGGQLAVNEPEAVDILQSQRILVRDSSGAVSFLGGGQWADRLPRLVQARLVQTFENAARLRSVSRPGGRISADYQLTGEIRSFEIQTATNEAVVEIAMKLVEDRSGRILAAKLFSARVPMAAIEAGAAAHALDEALSAVLIQIVRWM